MSPVVMSPEAANVARAAVQGSRPDGGCRCCLIINIIFPDDVTIKQECENDIPLCPQTPLDGVPR